jgi:hypothetical protein
MLGGRCGSVAWLPTCPDCPHPAQARNKTFDVAYEYQPDEGLQVYELVASIPKPAATSGSNYLAPALATLQKNT